MELFRHSTMLPRKYFDYPLEQGLRRSAAWLTLRTVRYFDYPLEQGLRRFVNNSFHK